MIYLIDFENVHEEGFSALGRLGDKDAVYCFFTRNAAKIGMSALASMRSGQLHFIEAESGKQSLDLALVSYLGYLIGTRPQELYYDIVSNDNGFAKVAEFWNKRGNGLRVRIRKTNDLKPKADTVKPNMQSTQNLRRQPVQPVQKVQEQVREETPQQGRALDENVQEQESIVMPIQAAAAEPTEETNKQEASTRQRTPRQRSQRQRRTRQEQPKSEHKAAEAAPMQNKEQPASPERESDAPATAESPNASEPKPKEPAPRVASEQERLNAEATEFIQAQAEKYRDDKNMKQLVYRAVVKKYGQKAGTQLYNSTKKYLLK